MGALTHVPGQRLWNLAVRQVCGSSIALGISKSSTSLSLDLEWSMVSNPTYQSCGAVVYVEMDSSGVLIAWATAPNRSNHQLSGHMLPIKC
jgi:hypothetical protein